MFIFNSFSVVLSSLCLSVAFVLCIFSFRETEIIYVAATEHLKQRGENETKSNVDKNMRPYLLSMKKGVSSCMKKGVSSVDKR